MLGRRADAIANEIRMRRRTNYSAVVVEGRDDRLFYEGRFNGNHCQVYVGESKENVIGAIRILEETGDSGVLGIVDADFDRVQKHSWQSANIVSPHTNDLETMLIQSEALDRVVNELGSRSKVNSLSTTVREMLATVCFPIGLLRLLSEREGLNLRFEGLPYQGFVDLREGNIDLYEMLKAVANRSMMPGLAVGDCVDKLQELSEKKFNAWDICVGEDMIAVLGLGLRSAFGNQTNLNTGASQLKLALRLAFSPSDFQTCPISASITKWEAENSPFRIL